MRCCVIRTPHTAPNTLAKKQYINAHDVFAEALQKKAEEEAAEAAEKARKEAELAAAEQLAAAQSAANAESAAAQKEDEARPRVQCMWPHITSCE